ncbi:hypothetical protein [Aliikangiella maris]|uniref:DUF4340 domain-containing protein n=2 Tax=Aliikangiella maris TaxID=3162458 RepID=A0ABV3MT78_9GAMM
MKSKFIIFASFVCLFIIISQLIKNKHEPITPEELNNLSTVVEQVFTSRMMQSSNTTTPQSATQPAASSSNEESIIAVIYIREQETWFFKARGLTSKVDEESGEFARLFLDELQFDSNQQPILSHIPKKYQSHSSEAMRLATYNINGLEVSLSTLPGQQNVTANITRWKRQLSLPPNAEEFVKFQDNERTVLVRLDQPTSASPATAQANAQPPAKEKLTDFLALELDSQWQIVESNAPMAAGSLQLNDNGEIYDVAVLRLPTTVPLERVLGIWKERAQIPADVALQMTQLESQHQQTWELIPLNNEQFDLLVGLHKGENQYTFLRISNGKKLTDSAKQQFEHLLKTTKVTKS